MRQLCVDAGPARRRRRPDRHRRIGKIRMVKGADAHKDQMRPRLCLTEERRPARRAESPVHLVATVRDTWIVVGLAGHDECRCTEAGVDRSASGIEILALPAPANARDNRRRRAFPANCPTEASTLDRHSVLQPTTAKPLIAGCYVGDYMTCKSRSPAHDCASMVNRTTTIFDSPVWPLVAVDSIGQRNTC